MKNPGYRDAYHHVVRQENLARIKELLKKEGYYDEQSIDQIEYREQGELPYYFLTTDSTNYLGKGNYAMLDGLYLESILQQWEGIFYLPVILTRVVTNEKLKSFINPQFLLKHEIQHLQQIVQHIDQNPEYIEESMNYNVGSCSWTDVERSIRFEVNKIFSNEIPAFQADFENEDGVYYFFSEGVVSKLSVENQEDYVLYKVGSYLAGLKVAYLKKFPEHESEIQQHIQKETNIQGEMFFGKNTMEMLAGAFIKLISTMQRNAEHYEVGEI